MVASEALCAHYGIGRLVPDADDYVVADAILAAGYVKPRVITTLEELDALEISSLVRDRQGAIVVNDLAGWERNDWGYAPKLPATVLWEPTP